MAHRVTHETRIFWAPTAEQVLAEYSLALDSTPTGRSHRLTRNRYEHTCRAALERLGNDTTRAYELTASIRSQKNVTGA